MKTEKKIQKPIWRQRLVNVGIVSSGLIFCGGLYAYYRYYQVKQFESKFKEIIKNRYRKINLEDKPSLNSTIIWPLNSTLRSISKKSKTRLADIENHF